MTRILRIIQPQAGEATAAQSPIMSGSQDAIAQVIQNHHLAVRGYLLHLLRDAALADDLAQDVFVCFCQQRESFRGDGTLRAWLLGIARNLAVQHIRNEVRRRCRERHSLQLQLAQSRLDRSSDAIGSEDPERAFAALSHCLRRLAPEAKGTVDAHYFQGQTIAAIAQRQGRAAGAVRMMLMRIRGVLGQCIRAKLQQEP